MLKKSTIFELSKLFKLDNFLEKQKIGDRFEQIKLFKIFLSKDLKSV
jgi:hypothetical protein